MKSLIITLALVASTVAHAAGEPKLYVIGQDITGVDKAQALEAVVNNRDAMIYECKQQTKGRKGLENVSGSSLYVVGQVQGTISKWDALVAVVKGKGVALCTRKVINEQTANFKNF